MVLKDFIKLAFLKIFYIFLAFLFGFIIPILLSYYVIANLNNYEINFWTITTAIIILFSVIIGLYYEKKIKLLSFQ